MAESLPPEPPDFIHLVDPSYFDPDPIEPFRLLDLPRELRDMIYECMFTRDYIYIIPGECWKPGKRERNSQRWQLHSKQIHRTTFLKNTPAEYWSYEEEHDTDVEPGGNVNFFLASRQIYQEAFHIYYKNNFCFRNAWGYPGVNSVPACYAFLMDRSQHALDHLKHITLCITARNDHEATGCWLDNQHMFDLVGFINQRLTLESLGLALHGWPPDVRLATWDWLAPEQQFDTGPYAWIGALFELKPVKDLRISMYAAPGPAGRLAAFARLLRSTLLVNGDALGARNIKVYASHVGKWSRRREADGREVTGFKRKYTGCRDLEVLAHDDVGGRSLVEPAVRTAFMWEGAVAKRVANGEERETARQKVRAAAADGRYDMDENFPGTEDVDDSDVSDYDASDGGDDDSIKSLDLGDDVQVIRDEEYFRTFRDWPDRRDYLKGRRYRIGGKTVV
ncbi:hypothetical protein SLS54_009783 [Diplodia seriata]